jgi:hypothetical protein
MNSRLNDVDSLDMLADTLSSVSSVPVNTPFKKSPSMDETYYSSPVDSIAHSEPTRRRSGRLSQRSQSSVLSQSPEVLHNASSGTTRRSKRKRAVSRMVVSSDSEE